MYGSACKPREPSAAVSRNLSRRAEGVAGGSAAPSPCSGVTPAVWGSDSISVCGAGTRLSPVGLWRMSELPVLQAEMMVCVPGAEHSS